MHARRTTLENENRIRHMVETTTSGALLYLILPFTMYVLGALNIESIALSIAIALLAVLRWRWPAIIKTHHSIMFMWSFFAISGLLSVLTSVLATKSYSDSPKPEIVLFITMFIATMTSGIMFAFSSFPRVAIVLGALLIGPYVFWLANVSGVLNWWIMLGGFSYLGWNWVQVRRMFQNFCQLQETERTLYFQSHRLRDFIDSLPGYVSWFDNEMNYLDVNTRLAALNGLDRDELIGRNLGFSHPSDPLVNNIREFKNSDLDQEVKEFTVPSPDGERHVLTTFLRHKIDGNDEQISVLSIDITALKAQEIDLERRRLRVITQEKFSALGEMAGGIAHEINNPLAIICGKADVLLMQKARGTLTDEMLEKHLQGISQTSNRIIRIVKSLRTLVRDGTLDEIENTTIGYTVEPLIDILNSRLQNMGVDLQVDKNGFDIGIKCGIVELGQVLMNVIVNAAQAVEKLEEKWVRIEVTSDEKKVYLVVTDSGKGLKPEVERKLFQPFFTTKEPGVGTGIGLSLSRELMQKQNGDIYYRSGQPNTTFVLELPRADNRIVAA